MAQFAFWARCRPQTCILIRPSDTRSKAQSFNSSSTVRRKELNEMGQTVVDKVLEDRRTGEVTLWLSQPQPWNAPGVMHILRERLNSGFTHGLTD